MSSNRLEHGIFVVNRGTVSGHKENINTIIDFMDGDNEPAGARNLDNKGIAALALPSSFR